MKHYLYIIYSKDLDKFYTGETSNIEERITLHNTHTFKNAFTKAASDWKLMLCFPCKDRTEALFLERFIKRMKSKKFNQKIIDNPNLLFNIRQKDNPGSPEASGLEVPLTNPETFVSGFFVFNKFLESYSPGLLSIT